MTENRADVNSLAERLYYENVIRELGDSSEIIYLSVANAALAHLPYLIALDHQSRHSLPQTPKTLSILHGIYAGPTSSLSYTQQARRCFPRLACILTATLSVSLLQCLLPST